MIPAALGGPPRLRRGDYGEKIKGYNERYGGAVWPHLYQTDTSPTNRGAECGRQPSSTHAAFWRKEFEEPAVLILMKAESMSDLVGADVSIARAAASAGSSSDAWAALRSAPMTDSRPRKRPAEDARRGRFHRVADGTYTHNRVDHPLCRDFQKGECRGGIGMWCSLNKGHIHQCSKCLGPRHVAAGAEPPQGQAQRR